MFDALSHLKGLIFGNRDENLSIPIMDGALKPNNILENAPVLAERPGLEDLAVGPDGELYAACGSSVVQVTADGAFIEAARFDRDVTALAVLADGRLVVGLGNAVVLDAGRSGGGTVIDKADGQRFNAVNALSLKADGTLLITDGSTARPYGQWSHDLLEKGHSGRLFELDPKGGRASLIAAGLGYAFGAVADGAGRVLVSEPWRHQVSAVSGRDKPAPVLPAIPGYPSRIVPAKGGGFWLSVFACRTQLVEFVLCETDFRREMMRTVDPRYWVAPALSSGADFLEPLQGGGVKQMGILKPWAPPRSYGLIIRLSPDLVPTLSLHSRVGGKHHGIVAVAERGDDLFVLSKGAGRILKLSLADINTGERA